ncbi:F-box protein At3g07870-like [Solanum verrucosum]|uniref:F-box protein At3g07870-like n=1 Tax=Solanum verrucosum TaxID=315347 RepID=UPI0020D1E54D|nr:F-box protein At3g07870-like [Solanum verrucosum]
MKATRRKNIDKGGQQPKKKPNKKMKISVVRRKRSSEEEEGDYANIDYFNKLSDDVISSLFLRCTLKSLSMLRCTSKLWNNFITAPSFLHSHLTQSTQNGPKLLFLERICLYRSESSRLRFVSIDMDGNREELYTVTSRDYQLACATMQVRFGLVCLSTDCRLYLCNPALQQLCELPEYSLSATPGYCHFGFGYLHSRKEYKVVHFFYSFPSMTERWCHRGKLRVSHLKCEVLTINKVGGISFNRWKEIADRSPCHPRSEGQLVNECMYWWTYCVPRARVNQILSFDFENEKFLTISPPSPFEGDLGLFVMDLKGMVCLPDSACFRRSSILDLWILKDKINCTWVKEYSIRLIDFGFKKITYVFMTCNEEIIFQHLGKVVFYDLKRKSFREVEALSHPLLQYGVYSKSLFSLGTI